jgi:hypothetical protein
VDYEQKNEGKGTGGDGEEDTQYYNQSQFSQFKIDFPIALKLVQYGAIYYPDQEKYSRLSLPQIWFKMSAQHLCWWWYTVYILDAGCTLHFDSYLDL